MKKNLTALALSLSLSLALSNSALANNSNDKFTFVASDTSPETQVCMVAAAKGISAAKIEAKNLGVNFAIFNKEIKCNGQRLSKFVKSFNINELEKDTTVLAQKVDMTAGDGSLESRICVQAAKEGMKATKAIK
jgi:hypothetical protein